MSYGLRAFGLEIASERLLPGLLPVASQRGRELLSLTFGDRAPIEAMLAEPRTLRYIRSFDGSPYAMLEGESGDVVFHYGDRALFHLSSDLRVLSCAPDGTGSADLSWQRVLLDTVLWSVSHLRGFEMLHASAIETDRGAVAFCGHSGRGKTSIAAEFLRRGLPLFTDDILAIDDSEGDVLVDVGPPLMNLPDTFPLEYLPGALQLAEFADERWVQMPHASSSSARLAAVVLIDRAPGQRAGCEPLDATTLTLLPHAVGLPHVTGRAARRFELVGALAAHAHVLHLTGDTSTPAAELADLVSQCLEL